MRATLTKSSTDEDGRVRLEWVWEYTPAFGMIGRLADRILRGRETTQRGIEGSVAGIKRALESERAQPVGSGM